MDERCRRSQGPEAGSATDTPSAADVPAPAPSLLDLPVLVLNDIARRSVQLGAGGHLSVTCRAFSLANLLHAPGVHIQQCDQHLTPRVIAALRGRTSKLALTLHDEVHDHVMAALGSCTAVEACGFSRSLNGSDSERDSNPQPLDCTPGLAQGLLNSFPGLTALSLHGYSVTCSGLAGLLSHPQLALQLQQLDFLDTCILQPEQPGPGAVVPAHLFHGLKLKRLSLPIIGSELVLPDMQPLAQHLTQLTVEGQLWDEYHSAGLAAQLQPLAQLRVLRAAMHFVKGSLFDLPAALPQLHTLQLPWLCVKEGRIDELLAATQLTSVQFFSIEGLHSSRADVPCSWQRLELRHLSYATAAWLPLYSLTQPLVLDQLDIKVNAASSPEVAAETYSLAHVCKVPVVLKTLRLLGEHKGRSALGEAMAAQQRGHLERVVAMLQALQCSATAEVELFHIRDVCSSHVTMLAPVCQFCTRLRFVLGSMTPSLHFWRQLVQLMPTVQQVSFKCTEGSESEAMCESLQRMAEQPWARWLNITIVTPEQSHDLTSEFELPACWQTGCWFKAGHNSWSMTGKFQVTISGHVYGL
ncbi:hypothetical protein QJQ45_012339 [Haematococcus lacustris]|nr:hypothetical protein QJQ45_012339 [Haematococcus lacustris]